MFDLESAVGTWRREWEVGAAIDAEALDELECHLRDAVEWRCARGEAPEQAWTAALAQLGSRGGVAEEFRRLQSPAWLPIRLAWGGLALIALLLAVGFGYRWWSRPGPITGVDLLLTVHVAALTLGYCFAFATGVLSIGLLTTLRRRTLNSAQGRALRQTALRFAVVGLAMTAIGFVLGGAWSRTMLGRFWHSDPREFACLAIVGWYGVMAWLVATRRIAERGLAVLGVLGNEWAFLAWFGAPLLVATEPSGVAAHLAAWVVGWSAIHVVLLGLAIRIAARGKTMTIARD